MIAIYESVESAAGILKRRIMSTVEDVPEVVLASIKRVFGEALTPEAAVARLLADVRARGDDALREWTERIDGVATQALEVPKSAWAEAYDGLSPELRGAMERAAERIRDFHARQPIPNWTSDEMGGLLGQRLVPLERVGVYVPGGTAPLPSSLLMAAVPARVAGVDEVIVCTPADKQTGQPSPLILAAAQVAGVDRLFVLGGALAVAAMAFGTPSVPRVDKVVGAGGLFTTVAKRQVYGFVGLDGIYGPTETVVVADDSADPRWVAADLLAQAEHDVLATAILLTPSRALAEAVQVEVARQAARLTRRDTIEISLAGQGGIVLTPDLATAVAEADAFAPEHLCLSVADVETWAPQIRNAGGIFLGEHSFEVLGDYVAGPSHIMPTGGSARFKGPVNVLDFVKVINLIGLTAETASALAVDADRIARAESLTAHAAAARWRIGGAAEWRSKGAEGRRSTLQRPIQYPVSSIQYPVRPDIATMEPYTPIFPFEVLAARLGRAPEEIIKLDANENPYGPSPKVRAALADLKYIHIYPDPESRALREALAEFVDVPAELLLAGAGADELLDLIMRLFLAPGEEILNCPPTFGMYPFDAAISGAKVISVPRLEDYSLDIDGIEAAVDTRRPKLIFVTSPNNPDGGWVADEILERLLALPAMVVLDEAYVEFAGMERSRIHQVRSRDNLIVLRTFSKLAGLAGLRVGYGAFPAALMPHLWKIKQPYNVSVAASTAAIAALEDLAWLQDKVQRIVEERGRFTARLTSIPYLRPHPSQSNFILCQVLGRDAQELKLALEQEGILIRYYRKPRLRDHVRFTVGKPEQTDAVIAALERLA